MSVFARRALEEYLSVKQQIAELEARAAQIRADFAEELTTAEDHRLLIPLSEETTYQVKETSRTSKSCDWVTFKARDPELFASVVRESTATYVDIRKVKAVRN